MKIPTLLHDVKLLLKKTWIHTYKKKTTQKLVKKDLRKNNMAQCETRIGKNLFYDDIEDFITQP